MGCCRVNLSASFIRLVYRFGRKQHPIFHRSPAPQTSLIFKLPVELIIYIVSHISPDPQRTRHYPCFCIPYRKICDFHGQRVQFLRPLSATCRVMRGRLVPWVWERLAFPTKSTQGAITRNFSTIVNASRADKCLATSVKFMTMYFMWDMSTFPLFVECLKSLPNLHTLSIGRATDSNTTPLENALQGVELPQIKTLIAPPAAYPLLQRCCNVEDVVCAIRDITGPSSDGFFKSLMSNRDSKLKRLAIPLALLPDPPQFVAACRRLTELTIIFHHKYDVQHAEKGTLLDPAGRSRSAMSELVVACKALPDFDTLQVARITIVPPSLVCLCGWGGCGSRMNSTEQEEQILRKQTKDMKNWAIGCLTKPETRCREEEVERERKRTTLRVFMFGPGRPCHGSVEVKEYEV